MKKVLGFLVFLLLLAGGGIWYFTTFKLDSMIEQQIEQVASRSMGTVVSVGAVKTDLRQGSMTISDITIANPPGYRNPYAFKLSGIEATVEYDTLDVRRVIIEKPDIVVEEKNGQTNIQALLSGLDSLPEEPETDADGQPVPEIMIHLFRMNESRAAFESASLDKATTIEVDAVELTNIKGTPQVVATVIAREILNEIVSDAAMELLKTKASDKLNELFKRD